MPTYDVKLIVRHTVRVVADDEDEAGDAALEWYDDRTVTDDEVRATDLVSDENDPKARNFNKHKYEH